MKLFVDSGIVKEIEALAALGIIDGATTNPSLMAKAGRPMLDVIREIADIVPGPVSAEVTATDAPGMIKEGKKLHAIGHGRNNNIAIKVPLTPEGLKACKAFSSEGVMVNVTLCFSAAQSILAAKAGAAFVSPFVGRLDDIGQDGMALIDEIVQIYSQYPSFQTEVLVASVRGPIHVVAAAKLGADICTVPPNILRQLFSHPLTDKGLAAFLADWAKTGQSIL